MEQRFSASGRVELGGNHTDHQHGCVLAAAIDLAMQAEASPNGSGVLRVFSEGYAPVAVTLGAWDPREEERNTTAALVRGMAAQFAGRGAALSGADIHVTSHVPVGAGLSSSAALEVLLGRVYNGLFCGGAVSDEDIARMGQAAERDYFGKPCGLMDQMASSVEGLVYMDFADPAHPAVERIDCDLRRSGHALCIVDSGADHTALTADYAAIPDELGQVCRVFGKTYLREVDEAAFYRAIPRVRAAAGDRAVLRAIHVFDENRRAAAEADALRRRDFAAFLALVNASGISSWRCLTIAERRRIKPSSSGVSKHDVVPRWHVGPTGLAITRSVSASQSPYISTTFRKCPEVSPLVHSVWRVRLKKVTCFVACVILNASSFI